MSHRRLGRTGLGVSPITLGTMGFGPPTTVATATKLVASAIEMGINAIDTANCYDGPERGECVQGHAESMLGEILSAGLRADVVLISKVGVPLRVGPQHRGLSATHIARELDNSLRRLQTDYLDVYMLHWPDPFSNVEEVLRAIDCAVSAGKVRYFGTSNHQAWQVSEYLWAADRRNWPMVSVSELPISLLDRRYENDLPFYERHDVGVLAYQPLKGGVLSERRLRNSAADQRLDSALAAGWDASVSIELKPVLTELCRLGEELGITLSDLAIAWTSAQEGVASVILGARSVEQLSTGLAATRVGLPPAILNAIDRLCPPPQKPVPRFER